MCHAFINEARFYHFLFQIDQDIAAEVQAAGCSCGGMLHSARYPRKPRGFRLLLDESYQTRLSFCCDRDGCRRRCTPPSVRFLGRKVYLSVIVILVMALEQGLTGKRRQQLIEALDIWPQTLSRWRHWWRQTFPNSRCWQAVKSLFMPPLDVHCFPDSLLGRLQGADLIQRLFFFLRLLLPITTVSCPRSMRVLINPQNM